MTKRFTTRNGVFYTDNLTGYEFECYGEVVDIMNELADENEQLKQQVAFLEEFLKSGVQYEYYQKVYDENEQLKQQLFETSKELLWATSDEVDRALHYEDEVEELRKEIFE